MVCIALIVHNYSLKLFICTIIYSLLKYILCNNSPNIVFTVIIRIDYFHLKYKPITYFI